MENCWVERFEGLARSFLIAAPLLHNEPEAAAEATSEGVLLETDSSPVTPGTPNYLLRVEEIFPEAQEGDGVPAHVRVRIPRDRPVHMPGSNLGELYEGREGPHCGLSVEFRPLVYGPPQLASVQHADSGISGQGVDIRSIMG